MHKRTPQIFSTEGGKYDFENGGDMSFYVKKFFLIFCIGFSTFFKYTMRTGSGCENLAGIRTPGRSVVAADSPGFLIQASI